PPSRRVPIFFGTVSSLFDPSMFQGDFGIVVFTVVIATTSTLLIAPLGIGAALALANWRSTSRTRVFVKSVVETALSLPLVLPPTAVGLMLLMVLHRKSTLGRILDALGVDVLFTPKAVVLATSVMSFPLLVRYARTAFEEVDPDLVA